jgi:hypothetical protein
MIGGMLSVFALVAWRTPDYEGPFAWRERFLRRTWPVWPVLLIIGVFRLVFLGR